MARMPDDQHVHVHIVFDVDEDIPEEGKSAEFVRGYVAGKRAERLRQLRIRENVVTYPSEPPTAGYRAGGPNG